MSKENSVVVGSKWWFITDITGSTVRRVYPVLSVIGGTVKVKTQTTNHTESMESFLSRFIPAKEPEKTFIMGTIGLMVQAANAGLKYESEKLLLEMEI